MDNRLCGECPIGKIETIVGNGITEPPYLSLVRCPFDNKFYKYRDDECNHQEELKKDITNIK